VEEYNVSEKGEGDFPESEISARLGPETLGLLKDVGRAITSLLGKWCEVVIHDTSDLEHSIVWLHGNVTGRRPGGMMTDLGLEMLRRGQTQPLLNYTTYTESGKTLRSASLWLRDEKGEICGGFCINLDVTPMMALREFGRDLAPGDARTDLSEAHVADLGDLIDTLIAECEYRMGTPADEMSKDQRLEVVNFLDGRGAFQVRNSAVIVANRLGVTRKTIYNYLREIERDNAEATGMG
jgi:predicted transcriptional regulator YheO